MGEIGTPIFKILSSSTITEGYDINPKLIPKLKSNFSNYPVDFIHICIPFNSNFNKNVLSLKKKFNPKGIVIHSTISPGTTKILQSKIDDVPIIYSATRGVHKRMLSDLKKYTKFYSISDFAPNSKWASSYFVKIMRKCEIKIKKMSSPVTLELAKIITDTSYYGWLINYAQLSNMIARKYDVDYDEMWEFSDEIHKFLGNRPKLFPGFIGGHCVIPNLNLINEESLWQINKINNFYAKKIPNVKSINKKYDKSKKQSYDI